MNSKSHLSTKTVTITTTEGEWDHIQDMIKKMGKTNISSYIISETHRLTNIFKDCPHCITRASGAKMEKRPAIPISSLAAIEEIARFMNRPVSAVINELIIAPLLRPETA